MSVEKISSEQARIQWRTLLDRADRNDTEIIIERHGKSTAVVIGYESYLALQAELTKLRSQSGEMEGGHRMADALARLAALPHRSAIPDPVSWQKDVRQDRSLPGRDA